MRNNALLITGASGFVGSHAVRFSTQNEAYEFVLATDLRMPEYQLPSSMKSFEFLQADLTSKESLFRLKERLYKIHADEITVWHIGGCFNYSASPELLYGVNIDGTRLLLEMLEGLRIKRFVFWSAGTVYGDFDDPDYQLPATEEYPANPKNHYGRSKKEAEKWVLFYGNKLYLPVTIMRIGAIYGPGSQYGMHCALALNASGQLAPLLVGCKEYKVAIVHVEDVVRVAHFLSHLEESKNEIYNVVGDSRTMAEIALFIGKELNNKPFTGFVLPSWVLKTLIKLVNKRAVQLGATPVIDPELGRLILLNSWISNEKLLRLAEKHSCNDLLKYRDPIEGLKQTIEWFKKGRPAQ